MGDIEAFLKKARAMSRLLSGYFVPEEVRLSKFKRFLKDDVLPFVANQHDVLLQERKDVFTELSDDIARKAAAFKDADPEQAKNLMLLILSVEQYLLAVEQVPWRIGRKAGWLEKARIRRIFRQLGYLSYKGRPVRGTRLIVELCGSLTRGASDYQFIMNSDHTLLPKPADWGLPKIYRKLDAELMLPEQLKAMMSDVDILIMNEVVFDSVPKQVRGALWLTVGEKYNVPLGPLLEKLHQALENTRIGGIRGRWVNYVVVGDEAGYAAYKESHESLLSKVQKQVATAVECMHVVILDETV